jgi:alkaline phosphatase
MKISNIRIALTTVIFFAALNSFASTPKNIIFMISDGCGYNHIEAASIFKRGATGVQIYQQFPIRYGMSTYSIDGIHYEPDSAWSRFNYVNNKPTDSAASATAIATGIKTYNGAVGVDTAKINLKNIIERLEEYEHESGKKHYRCCQNLTSSLHQGSA